ncbi:glycosyltransferase family 4 protein [Dyadobacter aurulentus]|uniref:glycosyltransferase family 4 protein n=1 Tax=Dyadobacter sp. UC 10 TaxID=2605428 RepID=UPI0011F31771|nr:glycosyltransferase family 4 protein [Dyadobacter sp. UC 10]KAA0993709.1 glycosyltransferase family 4 protein [Dyadobacter sp. UC 10]
MRVLIVHNQLWAHYKSRLFSDISQVFKNKYPQSELLVAQIALYEASRSVMQNDNAVTYEYPYKVLFERSLDSTTTGERRKALFKIFNEFKPDVLNVTGWGDVAQVQLMFYAKSRGVKVVISSESSSLDHSRSWWKEALKSFIVTKANAFFCFGKTSADYLESLGVHAQDIAVRNAAVIDEEIIKSNFEKSKRQLAATAGNEDLVKKFIYVGRQAPEKNLEMLIRAFAKVQQHNKAGTEHWQLLLVGDGPERQHLELLTKELRIEDSVLFAGGFPWYEVPSKLAESDILILPSKSEPWGLVVNEAMVCGMPVIVSEKCGCVPDLVENGVNGFTFHAEKQEELEKTMQFFIDNPEKIKAMGAQSLAKIKPFASEKVAEQMVETFRQLAKS